MVCQEIEPSHYIIETQWVFVSWSNLYIKHAVLTPELKEMASGEIGPA